MASPRQTALAGARTLLQNSAAMLHIHATRSRTSMGGNVLHRADMIKQLTPVLRGPVDLLLRKVHYVTFEATFQAHFWAHQCCSLTVVHCSTASPDLRVVTRQVPSQILAIASVDVAAPYRNGEPVDIRRHF